MATDRETIEAYVAATAACLRLDIKAEWKDGVAQNMSTLMDAIEYFSGVPLNDESEPAVVFRA
ncbi:DUF4089 domain-containing protein [Candidatus Raskinella chloraquaticus]|uniref:DUF4089 domain-containing protein n=1 Tax=Candidatus Raskinella chloraquaticus TaxID=1951219 RepID=A0A1W9HXZ2_9HYPH|nr:MAG: hypothetical protein A4S15_08395 [Proteobacteria bacterium SG_bin8]